MAGGRLWTDKEKQYLQKNYPGITVKEASKTLKRTEAAILNKIQEFGINKPLKKWTPEEDKIIIEKYPTHTAKELMPLLSRSETSIHKRAQDLAVKKNKSHRPYNPWTEKDDKTLLRLHSEGLMRIEIAARMERPVSTISKKLGEHGLAKITGHRYILAKAGLLEPGK